MLAALRVVLELPARPVRLVREVDR